MIETGGLKNVVTFIQTILSFVLSGRIIVIADVSRSIFMMYESRNIQFARIRTSSLIKIEKILNRPITKFYNSDDVNVIAAELRVTKTRPASLYKRHNLL